MPPSILNSLLGNQGDPGSFLKAELEEAISPVTGRVERLEKKLDLLLLRLDNIEKLLKSLQPIASLLSKIPFLK